MQPKYAIGVTIENNIDKKKVIRPITQRKEQAKYNKYLNLYLLKNTTNIEQIIIMILKLIHKPLINLVAKIT